MKTPKVIKCFIKKCCNYDCIHNRSGDCEYGEKLDVFNCFEYRHESDKDWETLEIRDSTDDTQTT
jgi:hypothetical protein